MSPHRVWCARGFSLIELMVSVAIVGVLASVAVAEFRRQQFRAKSAERATIMEAIGRGVNDVVMQRDGNPQRVPNDLFVGAANPVGAPGTTKRPFTWSLPGWTTLPTLVKGHSFYSYSFVAADPAPRGSNVTLTVTAEGDLDGDGVSSWKLVNYSGVGYVFRVTSEVPERGAEDTTTYGTF